MGKKLVVVESPAKAKTINKILGGGYTVHASMGHVRDLPKRSLGVDIAQGFKPRYETIKGRQQTLKTLRNLAATSDEIILAPDPDREGEAIAWHLKAALGDTDGRFLRVSYNEITPSAIREAFAAPRDIDMHRVDAQQARRVLDRLVGYKVSPLLWKRIAGGQSAGRVQSVALRLVCEREKEIRDFVKTVYWLVGARLRKQEEPRDPFEVRLVRIGKAKPDLRNEAEAAKVAEAAGKRAFAVRAIRRREVNRRPKPPFITSTLQQAGSVECGFSPSRTMRAAQRLYEGIDFGEGPEGLITYMRTDSVSVSRQAQEQARSFIAARWGKEYVPPQPNVYRTRGAAQEAHEAIRPTHVDLLPEQVGKHLQADERKLYGLIWRRFVASQMCAARVAQCTVDIDALPAEGEPPGAEPFLFRAAYSDVLFEGFLKAGGEERRKKSAEPRRNGQAAPGADEEAAALPPLREGEPLECLEALKAEKETKPPPRYTEAALVRALEENGVGRPSTYASILSTLHDRDYVTREKRALAPTKLGEQVNEFLVSHLDRLFDVNFTAGMEARLDEIEKGKVDWKEMLGSFYKDLSAWLEQARGPSAEPSQVEALLELLDGVREWAPEQTRGRRTYSDKKFMSSVRDQLTAGHKAVSQRQLDALVGLVARYRDQLPAWREACEPLGLAEAVEEAAKSMVPPREATKEKLGLLLEKATFEKPRKVGSRTYDDRAFCVSLHDQVRAGRRLSDKQIMYLDRLLLKYADALGGRQDLVARFGIDCSAPRDDGGEAKALLEALAGVTEWKAPAKRGKKTWDDRAFFESLREQHKRSGQLSPRQAASLKRLAKKYGIPPPGHPAQGEEKEAAAP